MKTRAEAILNLSALLNHDAVHDDVEVEGLLVPETDVKVNLTEPLQWSLNVRSTGGDNDYIVTGEVSGAALLECRRCLTEVPTTSRASFIYPMQYKPSQEGLSLLEDDDADDILIFGQPEVDFGPLLAQIFLIDLPITALCKESCKGLSVDGVNLNDHPDHIVEEELSNDSPFAALKDLDV